MWCNKAVCVLAWEGNAIGRVPLPVRRGISTLSYLSTDLWTWSFAHVLVMIAGIQRQGQKSVQNMRATRGRQRPISTDQGPDLQNVLRFIVRLS